MVVGAAGTALWQAQAVLARAASVRVGGRKCAVGAATPLSALIAARRAGGPAFAVRDYGRCGRAPADAGQLFVYKLGGERNHGQDGWEYKVDGVAGSTGAADLSGPRGNGRRLGAGAQVLWFWCRAQGTGCQRTLEARAASTSPVHGQELAVSVVARDNEGRKVPVAGALVTLGSTSASTGATGSATLTAPATPGSYQLTATSPGLVPAFPETIEVQ